MRSKYKILKEHGCSIPALNSKQEAAMDEYLKQFILWMERKRVTLEGVTMKGAAWSIGNSFHTNDTLYQQFLFDITKQNEATQK